MIASANKFQSFVTTEVLRNVTFHIEAKENGVGRRHGPEINAFPHPSRRLARSRASLPAKNLRIGYLAQNAEISATTVQEELLKCLTAVQLENQLRAME
ncbi:MAG: hypothetical protein ACLTXL_15855 [Clostridia bacterium]